MSKLKQKKYVASILIMVIVLGIIGLFSYGKVDKYKGQIKVGKAKLLGSVVDTGLVTSKGTEEVKYNLTYTLDEVEGLETRDVVIKGKLNSPYARFKEINKDNITSTLKEDGKEIEINIEDVRLGEQKELELIIKVLNAPNKEEITPEISIKEKTGEETRVSGNPIKVETNSIQGIVLDENNLPVSNIELSINKNGREIKRTYTSVEGNYVFSDLEEGEYIIKVEEDIYEIESGEKVTPGDENNKIKVKQVDKYNVETKKYIEKLDLVVNGKENHYTYKDSEKVIQNVKNAKRISGKIEYKIVVRNKSDKQVEIDEVEDTPGEGLEFKESENTGWKNKNGKIVYELMEGVSLRGKEKREIKLVLSINDTNEIKTYINKMTSRGEIKEKVVFVIDNKVKREIEVTEGTVIERPHFDIDDLDGWYTDSNYTNKYKFSNRVNKDLILYARTKEEKEKYQVRYIDKNEVIKTEEIEEGNKTSTPSDPSKRGYTFNCWKKGISCFDFDSEIHEDTNLISDYQVITYDITYNLRGGTVSGNPDTYTVETNPFTLNNPEKEGYTFVGWTGSNGDTPELTVTLPEEELGDKNYTANYSINRYELEIDPKGGNYPEELLIEGDYGSIITISEPTKEGYTFTGWTLSGKGTYNNGIYTFGEGNGKLEANYSPIEYTITYKEITEEERNLLNNPVIYNVETNEFTLNNPSNRLDGDGKGEVFVGWKEKNENTPSMVITLPDRNNLGNKEYTAVWQEREADRWNITYDFDGATTIPTNPSSYVRSDLPITLNNPTKTGYEFTGWTGSNGETPSAHVVIPRGTEEDLSYKANFTLNNYRVTYDYTSCNLNDEEITTLNNRGSYTVLDDNFTLNNPNKYGYVFTGWTGTDLEEKTLNVLVETNKAKNLSYKANCELDKYEVEFYNYVPNSEYSLVKTVEDIEYNTLIPTSEIPSVSLRGYTFKYWSLDKTNEYDFNTPITKNTKLYAVYQKDTYNITYELDGGTVTGNPDTYQVDTESFTLNNPSKTGYEFIGWTGSNGDNPLKTVTLPEEELGDKNYTANYKKEKYIVTYMNGETKHDEEEVEYNEKATGNVETPTKAHNIFKGWTLNDELYDFNTPVTSNITLYASFEEVEAPSITHTPTTWVPDKVTVTIGNKGTQGKDYTGYSYKYKIGSGNYQDYNGPFEVDENTTVYAYSVKNDISSVESSHEINNIDKINPRINSKTVTSLAPTSVTLNIKGQDLESGFAFLKVYLGSDEVFSTSEYPGNDNNEKEIDVNISNLEQLTTYTFTIEVIDKVGNTYQEEIEVSTPEKHYVARTLEDDGTEIKKYETLKEAIESTECISICNIEMLDNVEETNSVLEGQDIKLDLNGYTITGLQDKAFENNGIFKIVDYNDEEIGKIYSLGTAIVNTGKLTIGENEEPLVVSKIEPIIEGSVTGINSPGELYFYDGKIMGGSTTGALKGTAPITPYSYNASVDTIEGKEIATLEIIADAEARINSVYYTKVQEAVDASKNGSYTYSDEPKEIIKQSKVTSDYGFIYDENTGTLKSNNQGKANTTATSYIYIDTRGEANDKILSIDASIESESSDYGYITLTNNTTIPTYDQTTGRIMLISGIINDNANYLLEKNKEYYLHIGYRKNESVNTGSDTFTINSIKLSDYSLSNINDYSDYLVSDSEYHFKKDSNGDYVNNNGNFGATTAHSYIKIDMTDVDEEKVLYLEASAYIRKYNGWGTPIYGYPYVTITASAEIPPYDQEEGRIYYFTQDQARQNFEIRLKPNQVNYLHFGYYNISNNNSEFYFKIHSIRLEDEVVRESLGSDVTYNGTYYMYEKSVEEGVWKDLSGNGNDGYIYNSTWNSNQDGLVFNGTNSYVSLPEINPTELTVRAKFMIHQYQSQFVIGNYEGGGYAIYVNASKQLVGGVYVNGGYKEIKVANTQLDTLYDVTLTYDEQQVNLYVNGVRQTPIDVEGTIVPPSKNTHLMLGTNPVRNESNSQFLNGTIYDIKVYDKALSDAEVDADTTEDGLLIHLDGSNHDKTLDHPFLMNNNQGVASSIATSYMVFDLTNVPASKTIYVNCEIDADRYDLGTIHVTDNSNPVTPGNVTNRYVAISGVTQAQDYPVTLTGGRVNYLHFSYSNSYAYSSVATFKINYIKYYENSNSTTPTYIFSNQTDKKIERTITFNSNPDTVQIIRNITMTNPLDIVETRDVILDLNGYTLTTATDDYVIDNKGSLKIVDSDYSGKKEAAQEKYDREEAEYQHIYEEEQAENQEKYTQDVSDYHDFIDDYKENNLIQIYHYTGNVQEFTAPTTGTYRVELWGAQGGTVGSYPGGKGAYTSGTISLTKGQKLYLYVGGQPANDSRQSGGYNGGGNVSPSDDGTGRAGGGSTDIRLTNGDWSDQESLASRIMVAAGGGGSACESNGWCASGGAGGALTGEIPTNMGTYASGYYGTGGTQTIGGTSIDSSSHRPSGLDLNGYFGKGGDSGSVDDCGSGGSGYYGGGGSNYASAGGGGSSYISGYEGSVAIKSSSEIVPKDGCVDGTTDVACSYHYSGTKFEDSIMISGRDSMPDYSGTTTMTGNEGNGYAKIELLNGDTEEITDEYVEEALSGYSYNYSYNGSYQEFIAPVTAKYKIEAWGGSGSVDAYGAYTSGDIELQKGEKLYIYVGNTWTSGTNKKTFNGGTGNQGGYNGGSSTDIRLVSGAWDDSESLASRIMVAGAGGSGDGSQKKPGAAGGLEGYTGGGTSGGTQTTVGSEESSSYTSSSFGIANGGCTGGNGYYPGSGASCVMGAGGGSSFISGHRGSVAITASDDTTPKSGCDNGTDDITCSYHYSGKVFSNTKMIDGKGYKWTYIKDNAASGMPSIDGTITTNGNPNAGAVKITIATPELQQAVRKHAVLDTNYTQDGNICSTTNDLILNEAGAYLDFDEGIITIDKDGTYAGIINRGTLIMGDDAHINGLRTNNRGIINQSTGDIIPGTGNITMSGSSSISILNDSQIDSEIKGYNLRVTNTNSYNIYNRSILPLTIDGLNTDGSGIDIYQETDVDLLVKNSTLGSTANESYYSNETSVESNVTFDNCNIKNRIYNRNNSARTILIKDSNLTSSRGNVVNSGGKVTVQDSTLEKIGDTVQGNIVNYSTMEVNNCTLVSNSSNEYYGYNISNSESSRSSPYATIVINNSTLDSNTINIRNHTGEATFNGCELSSGGTSVYNGGHYYNPLPATTNLNNTEINKKNSNDSSIIYNYSGTMTINGGKVTSASDNSTAVYNEGSNTINITGNFTTGDNLTYGIYNKSTVTLGNNEDEVSKTYPSINATGSAIYNADDSTFNYYDGKLVGVKDNTIDGPINEVATSHDINVTKGDTLETIVLKTKEELDQEQNYVARIGSTNYSTLQAAFDAVPNDNTETEVVILKDFETDSPVTIDSNKNVKLNYDGHIIKTYYKDSYLINNGTLTLIDGNDVVNNKSYSTFLIENNGTTNYNSIISIPIRTQNIVNNNQNATFNMNGGELYSYQTGLVNNNGLFNMTSGKIYTTRTDPYGSGGYNLIVNDTTGVMNISGGEMTHIGSGAVILNKNVVNVSNITLDLRGCSGYRVRYTTYFVNSSENSETNITGGTFGNTSYDGILLANGGTALVENINSNLYGSVVNSGNVLINNVTMHNLYSITGTDRSPAMYTYNSGTMTIRNSSFRGTTNNAGFICEGTNTITIEDSEIIIQPWTYSSLMRFNDNTTANISGSTLKLSYNNSYYWGPVIELNNNSSLTSTNNTFESLARYAQFGGTGGIYHNSTNNVTLTNTDINTTTRAIGRVNTGSLTVISGNYESAAAESLYNSATGTVTIGELGGVPSKTSPAFTGSNYGINNTNGDAIVNFYDGVFTGTTAIQGKINDIEPGYEIILETDDKEHKYLDKLPVVKNVRTTEEFFTIQDALDDQNLQSGDTLEVLRELTIMPDAEAIDVEAGKNVILDLKGFKITQNNERLIENNGTLSIKSTESGGLIESNSSYIFDNKGVLYIISGSYTNTTGQLILNTSVGSTTNMSGGDIYSHNTTVINNNGAFNMTGGNIYMTRTDMYDSGSNNLIVNDTTGTMTIDGGSTKSIGRGSTIYNKNLLTINDITADLYGNSGYRVRYWSNFIYNTEDAESYVNGGTYGSLNGDGSFMINYGTAEVNDVTSNFYGSVLNYGTCTLNNVKMKNLTMIGGVDRSPEGYMYNSGELNINGGEYSGTDNKNGFIVTAGDSITNLDGTVITKTNNRTPIVLTEGNSVFNIKDSLLTNAFNGYNNGGIKTTGNASVYLKDSTVSVVNSERWGDGLDSYAINHTSSGTVTLENSITNSYYSAIWKSGSGNLNIKSGQYTSTGEYGIYNSGTGTITIGELGGIVSKTDPEITGSRYGFYNSNANSEVYFYDGIITGQNDMYGTVTDIEPTYEIIQRNNGDNTYSKYLDQLPLVKNMSNNDEFNTIQDAISDPNFTNGDTLEMLRQLTALPSYTTVTIPSGTDVVIDMNGYKINQNNNLFFINNGTLKITDSSQTPGEIETFKNNVIENNGTLTIENIKIYSVSNGDTLFTNNLNATATLTNVNMSNLEYKIIENKGSLTITGGSYRKTNSAGAGNRYTDSLINNDEYATLDITNATIENKGDGTASIYNKNTLCITGVTFLEKGGGGSYNGPSVSIYNADTGTATVDSTLFTDSDKYGRVIVNYGIATIDNSNVNTRYVFNTYSGTLSFNNTNMPLSHNYASSSNLYNSSIVNINGGTISHVYDYMIYPHNSSTLNITNVSFTTAQYGFLFAEDNSTVNVTGGTYANTRSFNGDTGLFQFIESSTGKFTNVTTNAGYSYSIYAYGNSNILLQGGLLNSTIESVVLNGSSVANIISGNITSDTASAVYVTGTSTVNVGEKGGVPGTTSPELYGKTYGLYHNNNTSNFYFYDGLIKGETGSIFGTITNVEDGYKEKRDNVTDPNTGVATIDSTLTVVGDTERIAMVGTINFLSIQSAVNYASNNNIPDIQMFKSVTLDSDLVKPDGGANVVIHLNGTTITEGSYTIGDGITIDTGVDPGANISRFLANITGEEINPKNIVIYELEDGSKLESNKTYKLYKEIDGELKIVKVKENEIGNYDIGYDKEILRTTRSRIYINGIGEGTYKLVGSDSKEITFTIYHDGVSSNIRENNNINGSRVSTAIATLILSLQTGMVRNPYILIIMILIVGILGFIAYQKYRKEDYQE